MGSGVFLSTGCLPRDRGRSGGDHLDSEIVIKCKSTIPRAGPQHDTCTCTDKLEGGFSVTVAVLSGASYMYYCCARGCARIGHFPAVVVRDPGLPVAPPIAGEIDRLSVSELVRIFRVICHTRDRHRP
jgi:hypothetical protein